ncbi:COQ9 family protein [Phaeovulum sp.]|uniref:COQ9 family protein n=1 Tax=Phaeovulum sp. TaxID=2934796 RepID=UPI00356B059A
MKNSNLDVAAARADLLAAILPNVPFDGWSEPAFKAAVEASGIELALARLVCPRGAVDLAVAYHRAGDAAMLARLAEIDLSAMRIRDRVAMALRLRLEVADPELVRRGAAVFALPQNAATGAALIWATADAIWRALGDSSDDFNWYSKRMSLSAVYSACALFWMGDTSERQRDTEEFIARRVEDVMTFERFKGRIVDLPGVKDLLSGIRAPGAVRP